MTTTNTSAPTLHGVPIHINPHVPRGHTILATDPASHFAARALHVHSTWDLLTLTLGYQPLHTRHTLGIRELERTQRISKKSLKGRSAPQEDGS